MDRILNNEQCAEIVQELQQIQQAIEGKTYLQDKTIALTNTEQEIICDEPYLALNKVTVPGAAIDEKNINTNGTYNAESDNLIGYSKVTVNVPSATLKTKNVTSNGTYNASSDNADGYSSVVVNVPQSGVTLQSKTVTPTKQNQSVTADTGYDGLSNVQVEAIPNQYTDVSQTTAQASDVAKNKVFFDANGTLTVGTAEGGSGEALTILSYGNSTWQDFITAYNANAIVYCRASSNANPSTGSQTRLAFMAYVNNATNPTNVEFQYYRSVSSHSDSQQGDQVYVYTLNNNNTWTVTVRNAFTKIVAGTGLTSTYSNGVLTISLA